MFLVKDTDAFGILKDELRTVGPDRTLLFSEHFDPLKLERRTDFLNSAFNDSSSIKSEFVFTPLLQTFVYYGGAYTLPNARKEGVQTRLLQEALALLQPQIRASFELQTTGENESKVSKQQLIFIYGQVQSSMRSKGMIHVFADFAAQIALSLKPSLDTKSNSLFAITHHAYLAYKPSFEMNQQELQVSFPPENIGAGNVLILQMVQR